MKSLVVEIIKKKFDQEATDIEVKEDTYADQGSGKHNLSPRDRLLMVFGRRVRNMDKDHEIYPMVVNFLSALESLDPDEKMYYWKCSVGSQRWGGWATKQSILYCLNTER